MKKENNRCFVDVLCHCVETAHNEGLESARSLTTLVACFFVFKANGRAPGGEGAMPARHDDKTP